MHAFFGFWSDKMSQGACCLTVQALAYTLDVSLGLDASCRSCIFTELYT